MTSGKRPSKAELSRMKPSSSAPSSTIMRTMEAKPERVMSLNSAPMSRTSTVKASSEPDAVEEAKDARLVMK